LVAVQDSAIIDKVNAELEAQLKVLSTAPVARLAVAQGFAVLAKDIQDAVAISDNVAPEHLEIMTEDHQAVADMCKHYGGLFIGSVAAEVLGDYGAGPNHVLPTGGTGRYSGGLSVLNFLRVRTWMRIDDAVGSQQVVKDAVQLARLEGLEGHAKAAEKRLVTSENNNATEPATKKPKA